MTELLKTRRSRAYSPKVRTGCLECRRRHVKCDERKPHCQRCEKRGDECIYTEIKPWLFQRACTIAPEICDEWGTLEERQSHQFWVRHTGPWLANYGPGATGTTWKHILPLIAIKLPATRHMLVAISLLEQPLGLPDPQNLSRRCQRIVSHYGQSISTLRSQSVPNMDTIAASLLAWTFETMTKNFRRAQMHISASERMYKDVVKDVTQGDLVLFDQLHLLQLACKAFGATDKAASQGSAIEKDAVQENGGVFQTLMLRSAPSYISSSREGVAAFRKYIAGFEQAQATEMTDEDAGRFLKHWETLLLNRARVTTEAGVNYAAAHLLFRTGLVFLSSDEADGANIQALDYILQKFGNFIDLIQLLDKTDRDSLEEALNLGFTTIFKHARTVKHKERSMELLMQLYEKVRDKNAIPMKKGYTGMEPRCFPMLPRTLKSGIAPT